MLYLSIVVIASLFCISFNLQELKYKELMIIIRWHDSTVTTYSYCLYLVVTWNFTKVDSKQKQKKHSQVPNAIKSDNYYYSNDDAMLIGVQTVWVGYLDIDIDKAWTAHWDPGASTHTRRTYTPSILATCQCRASHPSYTVVTNNAVFPYSFLALTSAPLSRNDSIASVWPLSDAHISEV
jgi:hypothetical protein